MLKVKVTVFVLFFSALAVFTYIIWGTNLGAAFATREAPSLVPGNFSVSFDGNSFKRVIADKGGFYALKDRGITRFDNFGEIIWEYPLNYENPVLVHSGSYVAVSEHRARTYRAFNPYGSLYTLTFENDILSYHIAKNGYSVVVTESESGYGINVFNTAGNLVKHKGIEDRNLFPLSADISLDGRILVISYLDISGPNILSYICAYYIRESDAANHTDGLFASFRHLEGEIISKVRFIDSSNLMYSSDSQFGVYELAQGERVNYRWSRVLDNRAVFVNVVDNVGVAVAFGSSLLNREGYEEGTFIVYGVSGDELVSHTIDGSITYLSIGKEGAVIGGGALRRSFVAITYGNRVAWAHTATSDVLDFVILDRPGRALLVSPARMEIMEVR
ncbi:MAG: DUF5711 family protein [Defluviitaleaceae bacterium]|nr:DUF5711 family protein [Defluviitaleaceae bacterium]